jgi:hypothetical protein
MARKPFKIVNHLDLSGNNLMDVSAIYRGSYNALSNDLTIYAGSDPATSPDTNGGNLNLRSGAGNVANGSILIRVAGGDYGVDLAGSTAATITTNNQLITLAAGTAAVKITSTTDSSSATTGALQIAGGAFVAKSLYLNGGVIATTTATTWNILTTVATTINAFTSATAITLGSSSASAVVTLQSTKEASAVGTAALVVAGGASVAKALRVGGASYLGDNAADTTTASGAVTLTNSSASYPLTLGADVKLYRSAADILCIDDNVTINGVSGVSSVTTAATTYAFGTTDTLSVAKAGSTTTVLGKLVVDQDVEFKSYVPYLHFSALATAPITTTPGLLYYDSTTDGLVFTPATSDISLSLGQEQVVRVYNNSGATISNGTVVRRNGGASGDAITVLPAQANSAATSAVLGVATQDIAAGAYGFVTTQGLVHGVSTASTLGAIYLSAATAGAFTSTAPTGTNYVVEVGVVVATGVIHVNIRQAWDGTATYNSVRTATQLIHNDLQLPSKSSPSSTVEGSLIWNSTSKLLTVYNGTTRKVYVDTDTTQSLSNKTYNALTLTSATTGFTIAGGTAAATLTVQKSLSVTTGAVSLIGASAGSTLTLPTSATISALTANHVLYASAANTISGEAQLAVSRGGTGIAAWDTNYFYKGSGTAAVAKSNLYDDGNSVHVAASKGLVLDSGSGVLTVNHASTAATAAMALLHSGEKSADFIAASITSTATGNYVKKTLNVVSSGTVTSNYAIYSTASGGSSNYSFYGAAGQLYNANDIITAGSLQVNGGVVSSTSASVAMFNTRATALTMLTTASSILTIGAADASTRTTNIYSEVNIGTSEYERVVNHYGAYHYGGSTGFSIEWNSADNSLDFIKL